MLQHREDNEKMNAEDGDTLVCGRDKVASY